LVATRALDTKPALQGMTVLALEDLDKADREHENLPNRTTAENLAYAMYTSGSTGQPKGALIPHRAVTRTVRDTDSIKLGQSPVIAQGSNFCFDAATVEIWGALLNGGRLAGIPRTVALSVDDYAVALRGECITSVFITTDLFHQLVRARPDVFRSLDNVLVGGSALDARWD